MMKRMDPVQTGACAPQGFAAGSIFAGVKPDGKKDDVAIICSEVPAAAAAVYTRNLVKAACLHVTKEHLEDGMLQAVIVIPATPTWRPETAGCTPKKWPQRPQKS